MSNWTTSEQIWFTVDIICIVSVTATMVAVSGFQIFGVLSVLLCTVGAIKIYLKNNPALLGKN